MGETTVFIASHLPDKNFLGVEVHTPVIGSLLKLIGEQSLTNLRLIQHDAVEVVRDMIAPNSLAGIHVFFPDPWHKSRHHKRRLIQGPFVQRLAQHIKPGGYLHLATDWQPYAEQMLQVLSAEPQLRNTASDASGYAEKPAYRPLTKFENRGLKLGHGVWDLVFRRV
jgi:tRNA (guanine-N7-)-methyltransferase